MSQSDPLATLAWGLPVGAAWSLGIIPHSPDDVTISSVCSAIHLT
jgi:hypothetical protein